MGVYLCLDLVPERIAPEAWKKVYNETLSLLEGFHFLDVVAADNGHRYAVRTRHRENIIREYSGWRVTGDMETGDNMEYFFLIED